MNSILSGGTGENKLARFFSLKLVRLVLICIVSFCLVGLLSGAIVAKYAITIVDNDTKTLVFTSQKSPAMLLQEQNISLSPYDTFEYSGLTNDEATIIVNRAVKVNLTADSKVSEFNLTKGTVSDVLEMAKVSVNPEDLINVALSEPVCEGMDIVVNRVSHKEYKTQKEMPFAVVSYKTQTLPKGKTRTLSEGVNGIEERTVKQTLVDGTVTAEEVINYEVSKQPISAKVLVGDPTAPTSEVIPNTPIELDEKGNPVSYKQKVVGKATAYSTHGRRTWLKPGYVAMNTNQFPKGTKLYIKTPDGSFTYGYSVVKDTGPAVMNGDILVDLFFNTYKESCYFGAKNVEVYVL